MWEDRANAAFRYTGVETARVAIPYPLFTGGTATTSTPTTASGRIGAVVLTTALELDNITYNASIAGSANAVERIALYTMDGGTLLVNVTDAVGANTGERVVAVSPSVLLLPAMYYIFFCLSSGTTSPDVSTWASTASIFLAGASGEPDIEGAIDITGGAAPTTFTVTAITTPGVNATLMSRWDGTG